MSNAIPSNAGRILFADDDTHFQQGLAAVLCRSGFECVCVPSAADALALLPGTPFDVLIADIHMPGNADLKLIEEVQQRAAGLPVVLLTGLPSVETAARAVRLPVTAYLVKPPDLEELKSVLHRAVWDYRNYRMLQVQRKHLQHWEHELSEIESRFRKPPAGSAPGANVSFVRLTLRNLILTLNNLEQSVAVLEGSGVPAGDLRQADFVSALRRAVTVLEKTRQNFKSKELGELRQDLERVLATR